MNIIYLANIRLPTEKAHGAQIMKSCEAFVRAGSALTLVVTARKTQIQEDPLTYYGVTTPFPIFRVRTFDVLKWGKIGFFMESIVFALRSLRHISQRNADVVYGRDEIVLSVVGMFTKKPIVWESHDGAWNLFVRYLARRTLGMVVVSKKAVDFYAEKGIPREKLCGVPNGIDVEAFTHSENKHDARARLGIPLDKKIALYIGRLDGWKGVGTLLETSRLLPKNIQVVVIGGEKEQVARLSSEYPNVLFLGHRPYAELPNNQKAGDVLVVPNTAQNDVSLWFTSPLKLIAHLASGVPIVVSDLPSTREIAEESAIFVAPDDPQALFEGIMRGCANDDIIRSMVARAQERSSAFDWKKRAERIIMFCNTNIHMI